MKNRAVHLVYWIATSLALAEMLKASRITFWVFPTFLIILFLGILAILVFEAWMARYLGSQLRYSYESLWGFVRLHFTDPFSLMIVDDLRHYRKKLFAVILMGPILATVSVALFFLLMIVAYHVVPFSLWTESQKTQWIHLWVSATVAICIVCVCAVIVSVIQLSYLIRYWNYNPEEILLNSWGYRYWNELTLYRFFDEEERCAFLIERAQNSSDAKLSYFAGFYLFLQFPQRAADFFDRAITLETLPEEVKLAALDGAVTLRLFADPKPHLTKIEQYSKLLIEAKPEDWSIKGTRGAVLVELGRYDEGKPMLEGVLKHSKSTNDLVISAAYLGYASHLEGNMTDATAYMKRALEYDSQNPILKRFAFLLPGNKTQGVD